MKQFEIWWANLPAPAGGRTRVSAIPVEVKVGRREGLPAFCVANLDNSGLPRGWIPGQAHWRRRGTTS